MRRSLRGSRLIELLVQAVCPDSSDGDHQHTQHLLGSGQAHHEVGSVQEILACKYAHGGTYQEDKTATHEYGNEFVELILQAFDLRGRKHETSSRGGLQKTRNSPRAPKCVTETSLLQEGSCGVVSCRCKERSCRSFGSIPSFRERRGRPAGRSCYQ